MAQLKRFNPPVRKIAEGSFKRLSPINESEFLLRLLERPEFKGERGEKGDSGERGIDGARGPMGLPGVAGRDGEPGIDGKRGARGPQGKACIQGIQGMRGSDGKAGRAGEMGPRGAKGDRGEAGPRGPKGDQGPKGDKGEVGPVPKHEWDGTKLRFELPNGVWGPWVDLKGNQLVYQMNSSSPGAIVDSIWSKTTTLIPAGQTVVAASSALASMRHGEFICNFLNLTTNRESSLKVSAIKDDGQIKDQVYSRGGAQIDVDVNSIISGPDFQLSMTNNEADDLELILIKLII